MVNAKEFLYPEPDHHPDFPKMEREVLRRWKKDKTFLRSVEKPANGEPIQEYSFADGPPFANGLPHYGHLLTGFAKDAIPRYQTMKGNRVERRIGWDCHGLPAEMEVERALGLAGPTAIENFGIARFNDACRQSVLQYTSQWEKYLTRQGRWIDFENGYKTMDLKYMESVLWAFKTLYDKNLIYEGNRVLAYCWECQTPLSNFETRLDNATRPRVDPAVTVAFPLAPLPGENMPLSLLVWTTTPWTLPSNLALAVNPAMDYSVYEIENERYLLSKGTQSKYQKKLETAVRVATVKGGNLVGRSYVPIFPYFSNHPDSFVVLGADFVKNDEGTGIVHIAPGFGEDDHALSIENHINPVCPVDATGKFTSEITDLAGLLVFDANRPIIKMLKSKNRLFHEEQYTHNYPHCWRSDTPLIYRTLDSWFVNVSSIKQRALELNQEINWVPEHIKDGAFGNWLAGARDWSISRNRFWGTPIPVWRSDNPAYPRVDVYGSVEQLKKDFRVQLTDLHRPGIDNLVRPNPDDPSGLSMMRRVGGVLDCWFESGSMPFAEHHYPFENKAGVEKNIPVDFIVEYMGQTRAWFYNLHILSTALFDRPAFKNCLVHGVLLGEDGQKMSKRLRNYPNPNQVFKKYGADAMRWSLFSSSAFRGQELVIKDSIFQDALKDVILPFWNAWTFFSTYANADNYRACQDVSSSNLLDRYILAKSHELVDSVSKNLDNYNLSSACQEIQGFLGALNNWYIRRNRSRFYSAEPSPDKKAAYDTLYTVLKTLTKVSAPLLPFLSETIFTNLTGEPSVHLTSFPETRSLPADSNLVLEMDKVREVCQMAHSIRQAHNLRVRLPLPALTVAGPNAFVLKPYTELIQNELNLKDVIIQEDASTLAFKKLKVLTPVCGKRLGISVPLVLQAAATNHWTKDANGNILIAGECLKDKEYSLELVAPDTSKNYRRILADGITVLDLNCETSKELEQEGQVRDFVRLVQQARKDANLRVSDRIRLRLRLPEPSKSLGLSLDKFKEYFMNETLTVDFSWSEGLDVPTHEFDGLSLGVAFEVVPAASPSGLSLS